MTAFSTTAGATAHGQKLANSHNEDASYAMIS